MTDHDRRPRSPSRRPLSSIENKDEKLSITPEELDELIVKWHQAKTEAKELELAEMRYKRILHKVFDITGGDVIKGKDLKVIRRTQKRRFMTKANVPQDIYDRYAVSREILTLTIKEL